MDAYERVRVEFHPVASCASVDALVPREWEALARAFGTLEADGVAIHTGGISFWMWPAKLRDRLAQLAKDVEGQILCEMVRNGLRDEDWVVVASADLKRLLPLTPETRVEGMKWNVSARLIRDASTAKRTVLGADSDHKPTLSEQHGR